MLLIMDVSEQFTRQRNLISYKYKDVPSEECEYHFCHENKISMDDETYPREQYLGWTKKLQAVLSQVQASSVVSLPESCLIREGRE